MNQKPIVTVATLCYNNSELVMKTLTAIKKQTYNAIDHVILDDCSTDGSGERIDSWIRENNYECRYIINDTNLGICKSLNKILRIAKGHYWAVNCDDYWEPFHLEKSLELLQQTGADVIYIATNVCNSDGILLYKLEDTLKSLQYPRFDTLFDKANSIFLLSNEYSVDALFYSNYLHPISLVVPIAFLLSIGGYDEALPFEDYDMNFKICNRLKVCYNKSFEVIYYKHIKSYTENPLKKVPLRWGIIKTLAAHKHLVRIYSTQMQVEHTITKSCVEILKLQPGSFMKVLKTFKSIYPHYSFLHIVSLFGKHMYILNRHRLRVINSWYLKKRSLCIITI